MLPNKGGIVRAESLPDAKTACKYEPGDILLSNIRPYFCKIWFADREGCCSNDVLVIKTKDGWLPKFIYYVLSDQNFFNYDSVTSKGTKMPRGTKNAIMKYFVPDIDKAEQQKIVDVLSKYDSLIEANKKRIKNLQDQAAELYKEWFVRFRFPGWETAVFEKGLPKSWKIKRVSDIGDVKAGGDCPKVYSDFRTEYTPVPIYSNGLDNRGLYGYTDKPKIIKDSVTVSARGTIGYVCLREEPYVPIVRLVSVIPTSKDYPARFVYYLLSNMHIEGFGTSQQQLTVPFFKKRKILLPEPSVVKHFIDFANPIIDEQKHLERLISLAEKQRDNLLQKLLCGKVSC